MCGLHAVLRGRSVNPNLNSKAAIVHNLTGSTARPFTTGALAGTGGLRAERC